MPFGLPTPSPFMKAIFSCLINILESFLDNHSSTSILGSSISFWIWNSKFTYLCNLLEYFCEFSLESYNQNTMSCVTLNTVPSMIGTQTIHYVFLTHQHWHWTTLLTTAWSPYVYNGVITIVLIVCSNPRRIYLKKNWKGSTKLLCMYVCMYISA